MCRYALYCASDGFLLEIQLNIGRPFIVIISIKCQPAMVKGITAEPIGLSTKLAQWQLQLIWMSVRPSVFWTGWKLCIPWKLISPFTIISTESVVPTVDMKIIIIKASNGTETPPDQMHFLSHLYLSVCIAHWPPSWLMDRLINHSTRPQWIIIISTHWPICPSIREINRDMTTEQ